jgi:transitional endoplasmic reticulum ATPase
MMADKTPRKRRSPRATRRDTVALWTLRALRFRASYRRFVTADSVSDDAVLRSAGLPLEPGAKVDADALGGRIRRRLAYLERHGVDPTQPVVRNVELLGDALELTPEAREVLALAVLSEVDSGLRAALEQLFELECRSFIGFCSMLAVVLGRDREPVHEALAPEAALVSSGLLGLTSTWVYRSGLPFDVHRSALEGLLTEHEDARALVSSFLVYAVAPTLSLDDYPQIGRETTLVLTWLRRALADRLAGVNVLLYGPPGTGKTELSRALGHAADATCYQVSDEDEDGDPTNRRGRLRHYLMCQELLRGRGDSLVLFDEIEDVFPDHAVLPLPGIRRATDEKAWTNRLLEHNPAPTIWICNGLGHMDPAVLRRFDVVLHLDTPPRSVRRQLLGRHLEALPVREPWLDRMAADERLTPADIARIARVVAALGETDPGAVEDDFERLLDGNLAARGLPRRVHVPTTGAYDLELLNSPTDVPALVRGLAAQRSGSVCLYGPPGTGKTALAHHLAEVLDVPLLLKRASDLLGPYVGQTEAAIADMFRSARAEGALLLLDEADGFLRDRRRARQSWEVTQVNELLVQVEAHDGLFLASTNLVADLDPAVFRRFAVKVRFDPLTGSQRRRMLDVTLAALALEVGPTRRAELYRAVEALPGITPGDFAAVRRAAALVPTGPGRVIAALREELALRGPKSATVGFGH